MSLHDVKYDGGDDVESLTVADLVVPAGVGQQHALQNCTIIVVVFAAESAASRPVQVLRHTAPAGNFKKNAA